MVSWGADLIVDILSAAVRLATPIFLAALGEILAEKSGVLNIGLEGVMLIGSFVAFWTTYVSGSLYLGLLAAILVGVLMGLLIAVFSVT